MAEAITQGVVKAIAEVLKKNGESRIKLVRGIEKTLYDLSDTLKRIRFILYDAERRKYKDKDVHEWVLQLEETSHEMEDVLEEWRYRAMERKIKLDQRNDIAASTTFKDKFRSIVLPSCLCIKKGVIRYDIAMKVADVAAKLQEVVRKKNEFNFLVSGEPTIYTTSRSRRIQSVCGIDLQRVQGRTMDKSWLISKLLERGVGIVSIVGVGGLGKTTLAQLVYSDNSVKHFFDFRIWICVSNQFDLDNIVKMIIKSIDGSSLYDDELTDLNALLERLVNLVSGKKFLLVLDDVWIEERRWWEHLQYALKQGGADSKVLVTTRNERVAVNMETQEHNMYRLGLLSDEDCWLLLSSIALSGSDDKAYEDAGRCIAKKCNGLPLAAVTLGSLLQFKHSEDEWEDVLQSEMWELTEVQEELFRHLFLSYFELSPMQKYCFSYCASFPKNGKILVEDVIQKWMAQGYLGSGEENLERKGYELFLNLAMRSLFQEFVKSSDGTIYSFKMHPTVHDFAEFLRMGGRDERSEMVQTCRQVKAYRSLIVDEGAREISDCDWLMSVRVLRGRNSVMKCIPKLIHLKWLCMDHTVLSLEDLKSICKLYYLQTLSLKCCGVEEIPRDIGYLVELRYLDLGDNKALKEFPDSTSDLLDLHTLCVSSCTSLHGLPRGMKSLKHLKNAWTDNLKEIPEMAGLQTLTEFHVALSKTGCLKNSNELRYLRLIIGSTVDGDQLIMNAREVEIRAKIHLHSLKIEFSSSSKSSSSVEMSSSLGEAVMDALEPHRGVKELTITLYRGSRFPDWISSPYMRMKVVTFSYCETQSLPALGRLPRLEFVNINGMDGLQCLGREFLGIEFASDATSSTTNATAVAFPKLKELTIVNCNNWSKWEDITAEEADSPAAIMPCLSILTIRGCPRLEALPHHLLHKALSLEKVFLNSSDLLVQLYGDMENSPLKSSHLHNPALRLYF